MPRFTQAGRVKRSPFIVGIPVEGAGRSHELQEDRAEAEHVVLFSLLGLETLNSLVIGAASVIDIETTHLIIRECSSLLLHLPDQLFSMKSASSYRNCS